MPKGHYLRKPKASGVYILDGHSGTAKELAQIFNVTLGRIYQRLHESDKSDDGVQETPRPNPDPNLVGMYFRPTMFHHKTPVLYDAVIGDTVILADINRAINGEWQWNQYDIGTYQSRVELILKFLSIYDWTPYEV